MFILSSISSGFEFWSVKHTSIYENSELNVFKSIKFFGEICSNWPNDLLETNVYNTLESWQQSFLTLLQWTSTTWKISEWGKFSPFLSSFILLLVLLSNFIV